MTVSLDRVKSPFARLVDGLMRRVDWHAWYSARVVTQNVDGSLELRPDLERLPGLSKVPIRLGVPGVAVKVAPGSRVLVGFENGDPRRPVASIWEKSTLTEVSIEPTTLLALGNPATQAAMHGTYFVAQLQTLHSAIASAMTAVAAAEAANATLGAAIGVFATAVGLTNPVLVTPAATLNTAIGVAATAFGAAGTALGAAATAVTAFNTAGSAPPGFLSSLVKVK